MIAYETVENAPSLLRIHQILIDVTRVLKRFAHSALRDLVKSDASNALRLRFSTLLGFLLFLFAFGIVAQFFRQMRRDGFAFAIRIGREIDRIHPDRQLLQPGNNFLFARNDDVFGLEVVLDVDPERALGQILYVAERSLDGESLAQIFLDGLRLGGRLDDN